MLNMDFAVPVVIDTESCDWQPSPAAGVLRKPLAREEAERGHATSVVRYQPGASFRGHNHPGGEEIFVLSGVFSDETGDYPAGSYLRNPIGFQHAPYSTDGCELFVKLHQFQADDRQRICVDSLDASLWRSAETPGGLLHLPMANHRSEQVDLYAASESVEVEVRGGLEIDRHCEIFVLQGAIVINADTDTDRGGHYGAGCWLRQPVDKPIQLHFVEPATRIWLKRGHF